MGIYVNGLWMPTSKEVLMLAITADGEVYSIGFDNTIEGGIFLSHPSIYPIKAIPVPPHGRCIDADALETDLKRQCKEVFRTDAVSPDDYWITRNQAYNENLWKTWCESFYDYLKTRPTIIPASKEET